MAREFNGACAVRQCCLANWRSPHPLTVWNRRRKPRKQTKQVGTAAHRTALNPNPNPTSGWKKQRTMVKLVVSGTTAAAPEQRHPRIPSDSV